jgi:hypothetical protein
MKKNNFKYASTFTGIIILLSLTMWPLAQADVNPYTVTIEKIGSTYYAYDRNGSMLGGSDNLLELCNQQADAVSKGTFYFVGGTYYFDDEWVISKEINVVGEGETATTLSFVQGGIVYRGISTSAIKDLTLKGRSTLHSCGLTLDSTARMNIYNVYITNFETGINISQGMFASIYNPFVIENDVGVWIGNDYGTTRFFGGSIIFNRVGIEIYGGSSDSTMNQFYGPELECNTDCEVYFNGANGMVSGTIFQGAYFERTSNTSPYFFKYNGDQTQIKCITWTGCKFASQVESTLEIYGEGHIFDGNFFHGAPVNFIVSGAGHSITNNKALTEESARITFTNNAERTIVSGNYFYAVEINSVLPIVSGLGLLGLSVIAAGAIIKTRRYQK